MPHATAPDGVKLYYEEAGQGAPLLFIHEFAGDYRSWEAQMRFFSRRHRCITYSSRGYPLSDVPDQEDHYGAGHARDDALAVLDHLDIEKAYVVGLSMGAYAALMVGLEHPERVLGIGAVSGGSGSEPDLVDEFRETCRNRADEIERSGAAALLQAMGQGSGRVQFKNKNPRGYAEFLSWLQEHPTIGSALTMRCFQGGRPSLWEFADQFKQMSVPTLIVVGDEDEGCIRPGLYLKRTIPSSGLVFFPKTGHCVAQEEPDFFNRTLAEFIAQVEAGPWTPRDPAATLLPFPGVD